MRGVVFHGERELELMQFEDPTPDAHDVIVEMKASGMCSSDLHQYRRRTLCGADHVAGTRSENRAIIGEPLAAPGY